MRQIQEVANRHPSVATMLLEQFTDRNALRLYVLEVASLFPDADQPSAIDEIAQALALGSGRGPTPATVARADLADWYTLFAP